MPLGHFSRPHKWLCWQRLLQSFLYAALQLYGYMAWVSNIDLGAEILCYCQWTRDQCAQESRATYAILVASSTMRAPSE